MIQLILYMLIVTLGCWSLMLTADHALHIQCASDITDNTLHRYNVRVYDGSRLGLIVCLAVLVTLILLAAAERMLP